MDYRKLKCVMQPCRVTRKYKSCFTDTTVDFTVYDKTG